MPQNGPSHSSSLLDHAEHLISEKNYSDADLICHSILKENPENLEAHFILGTSAYQQQNWNASVYHYQRSIAIAPDVGFLHANLALAFLEWGRYEEAQEALSRSIRLDGQTVSNHYHQGLLFQKVGHLSEALEEYRSALAQNPAYLPAMINISALLIETGDVSGAIQQCMAGLSIAPDNPSLVGNLATAYGKQYRYDESLLQYELLLKLVPCNERAEVLGRMANIYIFSWRVNEGIACFGRAIASTKDSNQKRALSSNRLFVLHYSGEMTPEYISEEHKSWGKTYFCSHEAGKFMNVADPGRRLRIGYISPDLRIHAVVFFLQPVLAAHDRERFEIFCYSDVKKPDVVTKQLMEHPLRWRDIAGLDDDSVHQMILADQIDIMVDLAGHSSENRLPLFARGVAPVQATWIGYPNTTGLSAMDYRLTDPKADPYGMTEHLHTEELVRLPDTFLCYRPGSDFPVENPLPFLMNRVITFGSYSNFVKVTADMLDLWARILAAVEGSQLVFRARGMTETRFKNCILPIFERHGVDNGRIRMLGHVCSVTENLGDYHQVDIALDTFPYNGTTTTCESLYMGVPVITLAGRAHVSRVGVSLLQSVGLTELIAETPDDYVSIAIALAGDLRRLLSLRKSLRGMVLASPLTDNTVFTAHLENAYRTMWHRWCADQRRINMA